MKNMAKMVMLVVVVSSLLIYNVQLALCDELSGPESATFTWTPNTDVNLAGYKIYYGLSSRGYTVSLDVLNPVPINGVIQFTVDFLPSDTTLYFAAVAYDTDGFESDYSLEVVYTTQNINIDTDGDGLIDTQENVTGTSIFLEDTDNDGIKDFEEYTYWGAAWNQDADNDGIINILDADSDNDGFLDGEEINLGKDPAVSTDSPAETIYEDAIDGYSTGWSKYGTTSVSAYLYTEYNPTLNKNVLKASTTSLTDCFILKNPDGTYWLNDYQKYAKWKMSATGNFTLYWRVETDVMDRYMVYTPRTISSYVNGVEVHTGLGTGIIGAGFRDYKRNLQYDLDVALKNSGLAPETIVHVEAFLLKKDATTDLSLVDLGLFLNSSETNYEDAIDGYSAGWSKYGTTSVSAYLYTSYNNTLSRDVLSTFTISSTDCFILKNSDGTYWFNTEQKFASWWMEAYEYFTIYWRIQTNIMDRYMVYTPRTISSYVNGVEVHTGLGTAIIGATGKTINRNLQYDLDVALKNSGLAPETIVHVEAFLVREDVNIVDIKLKTTH